MEQNRLTTDELRGMLDTYSPEQQQEEDAKAINEGAHALTVAAELLQRCIDTIPDVAEQLNRATTLKISDESKAAIVQAGEKVGESAAEAFKKNISPIIEQAQREVKHVSLPAPAAYCLFTTFVVLFVFALLVVLANYRLWGHEYMWYLGKCLLGGLVAFNVALLFMSRKGWI